jgi:hypothetical protein
MKNFFFENGSEQNSMIRLLSFITVITGLLIALIIVTYGIIKGCEGISVMGELIYLCFGILGFEFGGKVIQKFAENKKL